MKNSDQELEALRSQYGPLAGLIGVWEGQKGDDLAPSDDRGTENNKYREVMTFEPMGPIQNHEQTLYVLRYSTKIWRLNEPNTFHEELGYWSWDSKTNEIMRTFIVPRGIALIAGGHAGVSAKEFTLESKRGSPTYGICVGPFLDKEFKTTQYLFKLKFDSAQKISYEQDTVIEMPGHDVFHHRDRNELVRKS